MVDKLSTQKGTWRDTIRFFLRPVFLVKQYRRKDLPSDLVAGLTVAIVMLPQAIAYAMVAELPPQMGVYAAVAGTIAGGLWGSSALLLTGPTNTSSLLVLAVLLPIAGIGSPRYMLAASMLALLVGIFQLVLGMARLGMLVSFVSDSVIVGFTAGAGVLIIVNQVKVLFGLQIPTSASAIATIRNVLSRLPETHSLTLLLGIVVILFVSAVMHYKPQLPASLLALGIVTAVVWVFHLGKYGIALVGKIPIGLPPLTGFSGIDFRMFGELSSGVLAVGAIGLVQTMAVAKSLSLQSRKRFDGNQEFIGQGLANIASGMFTGYPVFGSFVRSAVNVRSGGKTSFSAVFAGLSMLMLAILFAPAVRFVPKTGLAGVLIVIASGMIDRSEIARIWRGAKGDLFIMAFTFGAVLLLPLQFAVLLGILASFAVYILRTSAPRIFPVLPNTSFDHLEFQPEKAPCPQMTVYDLHGDLYFGATRYIEDHILDNMKNHPEQRFLLLRMNHVNQCDISGIHTLENIVRQYRLNGGDVILINTQPDVLRMMKGTGFYRMLGEKHFIFDEKQAISFAFYHLLDPVVCIYECDRRVFFECQNLPKHLLPAEAARLPYLLPHGSVPEMTTETLWKAHKGKNPPMIIDVREPREFKRGHIPGAVSIPLFELLTADVQLPRDKPVVFVCRSGRRSARAAYTFLHEKGYPMVSVLSGGLQAWEFAGMLMAVEPVWQKEAGDE